MEKQRIIDRFDGEYRFLSNFYPCSIEYEGIIYPSTEHAYQASKAVDNIEYRKYVSNLETAGLSKKAGNGKLIDCPSFELREDWNDVKFQVMKDICKLKFIQPEFRQKLLDTGDAILIEGNWWHDNTWGVCSCPKCKEIEGKNWLGLLLMEIRGILQGKHYISEIID